MVEAYSQNDITESYSFTKLFLMFLAQIYVNILFVVMMNNRPKVLPESTERLYKFTLVFITIVNFIIPVPSLGGRFVVLCYSLVAVLWLNIIGLSRYNYLIYLMPVFMIRKIYVGLNLFLYFQAPSFFFTNPFTLLITNLQ